MNKKIIITAIVTLVVGLLLGWLIFGSSEAENADEHLQKKQYGPAPCTRRFVSRNRVTAPFAEWI
jgi:hypothetical protein